MSTHIEHGTRVRVKSIRELNALVLDFRRQVEAIARVAYQRKCAELVYQILDEATLQPTYKSFVDAVKREYATGPIESPRPILDTELRWIVRHIIADHQAAIAHTFKNGIRPTTGAVLSARFRIAPVSTYSCTRNPTTTTKSGASHARCRRLRVLEPYRSSRGYEPRPGSGDEADG